MEGQREGKRDCEVNKTPYKDITTNKVGEKKTKRHKDVSRKVKDSTRRQNGINESKDERKRRPVEKSRSKELKKMKH